jgi:PKD repeat protein
MRNPFKGVNIPPDALPRDEFFHTDSWKGGLDVSDAPEDSVPGQSFEMQDVEVTEDDRLIRAPGVSLVETLTHVPTQVILHAGFQYASATVFLAAPFIGVKSNAATEWFDAGIGGFSPFGYTNFAGYLLLTNGSKGIYVRKPGKLAIELIPGAPAGFSLAVFAGRVVVGGAQIDGKLDFMGVQWSDSTSDYAGWDPALGSAGQSLIGSMLRADRIQGFASLGFETLVVVNRRSIWIGVPTQDEFQPIRFSPRLEDTGCSHSQTITPTEYGVLFLSDDGVRLFTGSEAPLISAPINRLLGPIHESDTWTACFDPFRKRYYLHGPTGTFVFDILRRRWFRWTGVFLNSIFFPSQGSRLRWSDAVGTWGSQTLAWWQLLPQESGGSMYFVKGSEFGIEDPSTFSSLGSETIAPLWFDRVQVGENQDQLMTGLGARFTYEADAPSSIELWLPDKPDGNYEAVRTATLVPATGFTKRAWVPFIHTGRGIGLGLRITAGSPRIRRASVEFQRTGMLFEAPSDTVDQPVVNSDAILKPRPIWMDSFTLGPIQTLGWTIDEADLPSNPILIPDDDVRNPYLPLNTDAGINQYEVGGRYLFWNSYGIVKEPTTQVDYTIPLRFPQKSWQYNPTGGRRGRGSIISRADDTASLCGHWLAIPFKADSDFRAGETVIGLNLHGVVPPEDDLNIVGFVALLTLTDVPTINYDAIPHVVLAITADRHVVLKKFTLTEAAGSLGNPYNLGTWTTIATSTQTVPADGYFAIEAGIFLSSRNGLIDTEISDGFLFARLYNGSTVGELLFFEDMISNVNRIASSVLMGITVGTDTRAAAGDGAGNLTHGIAGIEFDSLVIADNKGDVKRHLYNALVDGILPVGIGSDQQSTPTGGTRLANVARKLNTFTDMLSYNYHAVAERDTFVLPGVIPQAKEILAVGLEHWFDGTLPPPQIFSGQGKELIIVGGTEVGIHRSVAGPAVAHANPVIGGPPSVFSTDMAIVETNPATTEKFKPEEIIGDILGWENDRVSPASGDTRLMQLALEYIYREEVITDLEHPAYPPIANFGWIFDSPDQHTIRVLETSIDRDGTIVQTRWDWGDGTFTTIAGPDSLVNGPRNHTYATPGAKTVMLTVTDNDGLTDSTSQVITIPNVLPTANFSFAANPGDISGLTVDFTDLSVDPDGTVVAWDWDFGDGSPHDTTQNPTHIYAGPGTPLVTLRVTDNNGGLSAPATTEVDVPIGAGGGDCTLSAGALADTAGYQGDDFAGGNPPLPSYVNTAAFDTYYTGSTFRNAYSNGYSAAGIDHAIDSSVQFNSRATLRMDWGTGHNGAGWDTVVTDDGDPTETPIVDGTGSGAAGPQSAWQRLIWMANVGIEPGTETTAFTGLLVHMTNGRNVNMSVYMRQGRLKIDVQKRASFAAAFTTVTYDLCASSLFERVDGVFGEIITLVELDEGANTLRVRAWAGDACSLGGVSPIVDQTVGAFGNSGSAINGRLQLDFGESRFNWTFTPTGAIKSLWVALWETVPKSIAANPFGVSLT